MQSPDLYALRDEFRSEVRDLRAETNRELRELESRLSRMSFERFEEKMWWLQIATFAVVIAVIIASARLS
jgi:hypothetical protein